LTDAALECNNLIEILELVWPYGVPDGVADESKLLELLHKALVSLPKLWTQVRAKDYSISLVYYFIFIVIIIVILFGLLCPH
jgi:tetratricopeptide repeat protein 7